MSIDCAIRKTDEIAIIRRRYDPELLRLGEARIERDVRGRRDVDRDAVRAGLRPDERGEPHGASLRLLDPRVAAREEEQIDDHHVFPRGYLTDSGEDVTATLRDCVLNRTLIDKETNIRIGKKAPAVYLAEIEAELGAERLDKVLGSHLLPGGADSSLREGRFSDFLEERQQRFSERIEEVTK